MQQPKVVTHMPDPDFFALKADLKAAKNNTITETLEGDSVPTIMWLQGNKVFSRMKDELLIKEILPLSQLEPDLIARSEMAKFAKWLQEEKGLPQQVAMAMALDIYNRYSIPKDTPIPDHLKAMVQIETTDASVE
jgi:hypothetical protein